LILRELVTRLRFTADSAKVSAFSRGIDRLKSGLISVAGRVKDLVFTLGGLTAALSLPAIIAVSDGYKLLQVRIKDATKAGEDYVKASAEISRISKETGVSLADTTDVYARLGVGLRKTASSSQILQLTQSVEQLGAISGASKTALSAGLLQFGQAMSAGIVRAEEFNSVVENLPMLAEEIAKGFDTDTGSLRKMVLEGEVLSNDVMNILLERAEQIQQRFDEMPLTFARVQNAAFVTFQETIGLIEKNTGVAQKLIDKLGSIVQWFDDNKEQVALFFINAIEKTEEFIEKIKGLRKALKILEAIIIGIVALNTTAFLINIIALLTQLPILIANVTLALEGVLIAMSFNPFMWIPLAVAALAVLAKAIWDAVHGEENWVSAMADIAVAIWQGFIDIVDGVLAAIAPHWNKAVEEFWSWWDGVVDATKNGMDSVYNVIRPYIDTIRSLIDSIIPQWMQDMMSGGSKNLYVGGLVGNDNRINEQLGARGSSSTSQVVNNNISINQTNNNQTTGSPADIGAETRRQADAAIKSAFPFLASQSLGAT
jgi:tape measure domain-containing protein